MAARWLPLESNPDVLNKYIQKLGVSSEWSVTDVMGLDPEMLEWIPKPVKAFILLFPISDTYEKHRGEEDALLQANPPKDLPADLFYMKQLIHNACGTIALVHSIANNKDISLNGDGVLAQYLAKARPLSVAERGKLLEGDEAFTESHQLLALEGQTATPEEPVAHHFIALVNSGGQLLELDGRKSFPIGHGATSDDTFVADAAAVCKAFIARDPEDVRFNVLAIVPADK